MTKIINSKHYDLEERTFQFANRVRQFVKKLPRTIGAIEDSKQVIRSSGSMGANYIEANEADTKKEFLYRIRVSRKESKETRYWLGLVDVQNDSGLEQERRNLIQEATELMNIFAAILNKGKQ